MQLTFLLTAILKHGPYKTISYIKSMELAMRYYRLTHTWRVPASCMPACSHNNRYSKLCKNISSLLLIAVLSPLQSTQGTLGSLGIIAPIWIRDAGEVHHAAAEGRVPHSCSHCDHQVAEKRFGERFIARAPPPRGHRGLRTLPYQLSAYGVM